MFHIYVYSSEKKSTRGGGICPQNSRGVHAPFALKILGGAHAPFAPPEYAPGYHWHLDSLNTYQMVMWGGPTHWYLVYNKCNGLHGLCTFFAVPLSFSFVQYLPYSIPSIASVLYMETIYSKGIVVFGRTISDQVKGWVIRTILDQVKGWVIFFKT